MCVDACFLFEGEAFVMKLSCDLETVMSDSGK